MGAGDFWLGMERERRKEENGRWEVLGGRPIRIGKGRGRSERRGEQLPSWKEEGERKEGTGREEEAASGLRAPGARPCTKVPPIQARCFMSQESMRCRQRRFSRPTDYTVHGHHLDPHLRPFYDLPSLGRVGLSLSTVTNSAGPSGDVSGPVGSKPSPRKHRLPWSVAVRAGKLIVAVVDVVIVVSTRLVKEVQPGSFIVGGA